MSEFGVDLGDLWREDRPDVTFRRVAVLTSQLRPGSRLAQARMSDDAWTADQYFYAALIDAVSHNTWVVVNRGMEKHKQTKHPDPLDRPADVRKQRSRADHARRQAARFLAGAATMSSPVPAPRSAEFVSLPLMG